MIYWVCHDLVFFFRRCGWSTLLGAVGPRAVAAPWPWGSGMMDLASEAVDDTDQGYVPWATT